MRKRGYPVDNFDTKVDMLSADHPEVVEQYRAAHAITGQQDRSTEDVRQAFMHYRLLFAALLDDGVPRHHARPQDDDRSGTTALTLRGPELMTKNLSSTKKRKKLSKKSFALPNKRKYPIPDKTHARNALARVAQNGTPAEQRKVKAAVKKRFPSIGKKKTKKKTA